MSKINLFSMFFPLCILGLYTIGISAQVEPPTCTSGPSIESPFDDNKDSYLTCTFTHTTLYKLDSDTVCHWVYQSDKNVAGITISSPGCITLDGVTEETSVSLKNVGTFAGFYRCHADYTSSDADPQQVNSYYQLSNNGVNLGDKCVSEDQCKTYRASCVETEYNETYTRKECQCDGTYSKQYTQSDKDGVSYVVACYNDNDTPQAASSNMQIAGLLVVVATSLFGIWGNRA